MFQRVVGAVVLVAALLTAPLAAPPSATAAPPGDRDVIATLFQWNWNSVAAACRDQLGPDGYGAVQVSPPSEHVVLGEQGYPWWQDYQPVSYRLDETRRGTRAEFAAMVDTCHDAGVQVYVDAVVNHMTGQDECGTGSAGSAYCHYDYAEAGYGYDDFHHCGRNGDDNIVDFHDRWEVQNCELVNLADLDTGSEYVRDRIGAYLNDLLSLGVDGFRIDAAKHMPAEDVAALVSRLDRPAYVYQEVLHGDGEPITPEEYLDNGDVYDQRYARDLAKVFNSEKLAYLRDFGTPVPSENVVVFVDNHDSQRGDETLTYRDGARYSLANAFMLAWPVGTPKINSSYTFDDYDAGPPSDAAGNTTDAACDSAAWQCEHDWQPIRNMVAFHNEVGDEPVVQWWDNGNDTIAFGRGDKGYVVINDESSAVTGRSFQTALPAGTYCDVLHGDVVEGACTGPTYTVDGGGWFRADVGAHDGVALHAGARVG
ncbi:glycosidase [Saccharomonospora azurea SZMC 14600]|uniref:alpha-amylase n=1 Tax=Saccharomonospora azurea TaxID=40988 RepID=UPI00023FF90B|nr:alpha-amylase family protein [Saccharomonospora azurea]EHK88249.1 glycosidase [Saccharomonospora azurea SZMC 14600]